MATFITYKNKKGEKRYRFKVYLGTDLVTGKRIETSRQGFKTKKEAQIALNRLQIEFKENKYKTNRHKFTFNDVYKRWYATYKNTVKETTAHVLAYRYDKYFKDGDVKRNPLTEFNSNNTELLTVEQVKEKLLSLPEIREELENWEQA